MIYDACKLIKTVDKMKSIDYCEQIAWKDKLNVAAYYFLEISSTITPPKPRIVFTFFLLKSFFGKKYLVDEYNQ